MKKILRSLVSVCMLALVFSAGAMASSTIPSNQNAIFDQIYSDGGSSFVIDQFNVGPYNGDIVAMVPPDLVNCMSLDFAASTNYKTSKTSGIIAEMKGGAASAFSKPAKLFI